MAVMAAVERITLIMESSWKKTGLNALEVKDFV